MDEAVSGQTSALSQNSLLKAFTESGELNADSLN